MVIGANQLTLTGPEVQVRYATRALLHQSSFNITDYDTALLELDRRRRQPRCLPGVAVPACPARSPRRRPARAAARAAGVSQRGGGAGGCSRGSRRRRLRPCRARRRRPSSPRLSAGRRASAGWGARGRRTREGDKRSCVGDLLGALWAVVEAASAGTSVLCLCEKGDAKVTEETGEISKKEKEMKTGKCHVLVAVPRVVFLTEPAAADLQDPAGDLQPTGSTS
ncbi:uncharacterized protein LOC133629448 [Colius striatus]|uniref:uncharacterized protein LOC133629448 n=1 Tax=Colius striatus TaxID=57412 RepID=UPI002B1D7905|nr:uncharacterized protein LOC133629448 [Colius striatus]